MITDRKRTIAPLNKLVHLTAWLPLLVLAYDGFAGNLTVNPIQDITFRTGKTALVLLMLSLACTPINTLMGWRQVLPLRRPLGLYAFGYAVTHFIVFAVIDYGADIVLLREAIFEKPYALVGFLALLMLVPLALTSTKKSMRQLGAAWKKLHRLVYAAGFLVIVHYSWVVKGDILGLRGNIMQPLLFGMMLVLLLILRIPFVKHWILAKRKNRVVWATYFNKVKNRTSDDARVAHSHLPAIQKTINNDN